MSAARESWSSEVGHHAPPLVADSLSKSFGDESEDAHEVISDISFSLREGEIVSIVGPSGCGKTTLLNVLCGLTPHTSGRLEWYGVPLSGGAPDSVGYMLQNDMLLPWRTALQNVTLGLEIKHVPRAESRETASMLLSKLGLEGYERHYPTTLSGGMRQRVALARTLAGNPQVLLLDEPFAALDFQTKLMLESDMARLVRGQGCSVLMITHDIEEAVSLSDRVIVLTHRPSRIKAVHKVEIQGDRTDMMAARDSSTFNGLVRTIWGELELDGTSRRPG